MARPRLNLSLKLSAVVVITIVASMILVDQLVMSPDRGAQKALLAVYTGAALAGGLAFGGALDLLVTRPLSSLLGQVRRAAATSWDRPLKAPRGGDEIEELGHALEDLRQTVVRHRTALAELNVALEDRVEQRTQELREAQEQLVQAEKLASIGRMAAGIAHEVNNPTGIVISRAGYLLSVADEEGLDPDVIDDIQVIEAQARRIASIAGDLLKFGRRSPLTTESVDLAKVAALTARVLGPTAHQRGVQLEVRAPDRSPVAGNRDKLEQVVFNLAKNAIQATSEGGIVTLEVAPRSLTVADTGSGIAPEDLPRVFDPFFTTKPVGEGTGLGLSVVYGIVQEHGGHITPESTLGEGTRFVVSFPEEDDA